MNQKIILEVIVTSKEEAILAQKYGANRLELIHAFEHGGLSPRVELTKNVCESVTIPVNVMLRSQASVDFDYTQADISQMQKELDFIRDNTKANGVVFGALDRNLNIHVKYLEQILANLGHLRFTFHRAIDVTRNILENYIILLDYTKVDHVLTSGGADVALNGVDNISQMVQLRYIKAKSNAVVLAGSGITPQNAKEIITKTKVTELHFGSGVRVNGILNPTAFTTLKIC